MSMRRASWPVARQPVFFPIRAQVPRKGQFLYPDTMLGQVGHVDVELARRKVSVAWAFKL
eukprot:8864395-Alexandrium_andersonii.AAC.1